MYLTEDDLDELGSAMNNVERRRLEEALQALRQEGQVAAAADAE